MTFYFILVQVMCSKEPNPAHLAIAECEARLSQQGRSVVVVTQNIDELHRRAGSQNVLELHGEYSPRHVTYSNTSNFMMISLLMIRNIVQRKRAYNLQKESYSWLK